MSQQGEGAEQIVNMATNGLASMTLTVGGVSIYLHYLITSIDFEMVIK